MVSYRLLITVGQIPTTSSNRLIYYDPDMTTTQGFQVQWLINLYHRICLEIRYRRKLRELRKRDPFIYK